MKRNYILKVTLFLTTVVLIVGIGGSFIGKSNTCSTESQVVKATIVDEKQNVDENKKIENTKQEQKDEKKKENLKVEEKSQELVNKSGYARDYYEKDGELFIIFDEAEFFRNEEARREYFKDGNVEEPMYEWGNDYYIRNNDNSTKVYKVNKDAKLELLAFEVGANDSIDLVSTTSDKVKEKIDQYKNDKYLERGLLFNIDETDDIVYGMRSIYTP